jgi:hypothetical protein
MRTGFRGIFFLGLVLAALVVLVEQPNYATRWARPAQVVVSALGLFTVLGRDDGPASTTWFVLALTAVTVGGLEVVRRRRLAVAAPL